MFVPVSLWFPAFVLTVAAEVPVVWFLCRGVEPGVVRIVVLVVFANLATHPAIWFIGTQLLTVGTAAFTFLAEAWAVGAEAIFYAAVFRGVTARRAIATSVAANATSVAAGIVVTTVGPVLFA